MDLHIELQKEIIEILSALSRDKTFWETPLAIGLLTALAAIGATVIDRWQAARRQERQSEIERHLRIHERQMEGLKALSQVAHSVSPNDEPRQGADSHEWLSPIVYSLSKVVATLDDFIKEYSYITPSNVTPHIRNAINIANVHKWGSINSEDPEYEPTGKEIDGIVELGAQLDEGVEKFKRAVGVPGA